MIPEWWGSLRSPPPYLLSHWNMDAAVPDNRTTIVAVPSERGMRWPSGGFDEVAVIDLSQADIECRLGRPMLDGVEAGMGAWRADGFFLSTGECMEVIIYIDAPADGFILRVDAGTPSDIAISHFLQAFEVADEHVRWRASSST